MVFHHPCCLTQNWCHEMVRSHFRTCMLRCFLIRIQTPARGFWGYPQQKEATINTHLPHPACPANAASLLAKDSHRGAIAIGSTELQLPSLPASPRDTSGGKREVTELAMRKRSSRTLGCLHTHGTSIPEK